MAMKVKLRNLDIQDASVSYRWRNDPVIWEKTGRNWNNQVSEDMERNWIKNVLQNGDQKRFAICVGDSEEYIGNVQLTNITEKEAQFHIFIGNKLYWGKGIGSEATKLMLLYVKENLALQNIYLYVKKNHTGAIKIYSKNGFYISKETDNEFLMICDLK